MHWGIEYKTTPNNEQKDLADFLFDNGVDIKYKTIMGVEIPSLVYIESEKQMNYGRCNQNVTRENREEECKVQ